jgi:hypothetical protein
MAARMPRIQSTLELFYEHKFSFVIVVSTHLSVAIFRKDLLSNITLWFCSAFWWQAIDKYSAFSVFIYMSRHDSVVKDEPNKKYQLYVNRERKYEVTLNPKWNFAWWLKLYVNVENRATEFPNKGWSDLISLVCIFLITGNKNPVYLKQKCCLPPAPQIYLH